jgi:TRAP-type uncharacterized transport system fused permease subunit
MIVSCIGIGMLAGGLHGYLLRWLPTWQRVVAVIAALSLVAPDIYADIIGLGLAVGLLGLQHFSESETASTSRAAREHAGGQGS